MIFEFYPMGESTGFFLTLLERSTGNGDLKMDFLGRVRYLSVVVGRERVRGCFCCRVNGKFQKRRENSKTVHPID